MKNVNAKPKAKKDDKNDLVLVDLMPDDKMIDAPMLCQMIGASHAGLHFMIKNGTFPQATMRIGKKRRWHLGTVRKIMKGEE